MKILVCVKQVPDMESRFQVQAGGTAIEEADLAFRVNEYDEFAIEEAVRLKEKLGEGSELTVLSLGPQRVAEAIKKALAMGCDQGIHILDTASRDPYQVASLIYQAVKDQDFEVIFTGMQSQDLGYAQTGLLLAELLGIEAVTTVVSFCQEGDGFLVQRELEGGQRMNLKLQAPALFTCQLGLNQPRYPTLPNIMKAKKKKITQLEAASLAPPAARSQTTSLRPPAKKGQAKFLEGDLGAMADQLVAELKAKSLI